MSRPSRAAFTLLFALACASPAPPEGSVATPPEANPEAASVPPPESLPDPTDPTPAPTNTPTPPPVGTAPVVAPPSVQTLFVREAQVDCQGEAPQKCLQVREREADPWRNFYTLIEGFTYEASYAYELRVEVTSIANPPMDASALKYRLVEVVSKRKVDPAAAK